MSKNVKCPYQVMSSVLAARTRPGYRQGFSLVEILTVVGIMTLLVGIAAPSLRMLEGNTLRSAADEIASSLEQARAHAMAHNTYVFVAFAESDGLDGSKAGVGRLSTVVLKSKDGTHSMGTSGSNLVMLSKPRSYTNLRASDSLPETENSRRPVVDSEFSLGNASFESEESIVAGGSQFRKIIQFDPRGMAAIQSANPEVPRWMEIGLVGARGNTVSAGANWAAVLIDGVSGSVKIYRP